MQIAPAILHKDSVFPFGDVGKDEHPTFLTLGPEGTSSNHAARQVARLWGGRIVLFDTYEQAAHGVHDDPKNNALIVANAYSRINAFYISHDLYPSAAFFCDTPEYIMASRPGVAIDGPMITIATHPAPSHLIPACLQRTDILIKEVDSTHQAAAMTARGEVDACVTTRTAADMLGLQTITSLISTIPMLWTIFISRDRLA